MHRPVTICFKLLMLVFYAYFDRFELFFLTVFSVIKSWHFFKTQKGAHLTVRALNIILCKEQYVEFNIKLLGAQVRSSAHDMGPQGFFKKKPTLDCTPFLAIGAIENRIFNSKFGVKKILHFNLGIFLIVLWSWKGCPNPVHLRYVYFSKLKNSIILYKKKS